MTGQNHQQKHSGDASNRDGVIGFMARNSITANLLMFLLIGGGFWTIFNIQKEVFPEFALDIVEVRVGYPGAAPAEVEKGILLPVEEAVRGVQGIRQITSEAREGRGEVLIELVSGAERMKVFQEIDQAVNRIRAFPEDIDQPEVRLQSQQRDVMEIGLFGNVDIWTLRILAEQLRDILLSTDGITQVEMGRVPDYVTHVEISAHKLQEYNLTLEQVSEIIEASSSDIPGGALETSGGEILLRMKERKQWAEEFADIAIIPSTSGSAVRLKDIASITDGFEETGFHGQFNQQPAVSLDIFRVGDQSPLDIEKQVLQVIADYQANLPPGVQVRIDGNRAEDYRERLTLLRTNGILAVIIVFFILSLFLQYRLAFWVMMGMAISFIGGFIFLPWIGVSLNMISMFGFLVALGIVVDDAIVVGENVYEYRSRGMSYMQAAIQGARDMARPVVFSILTNVIAFIPLLFIPGTTGKFWWPLPAVVIVMLLVSLFEALFILPAHLGHSSKKKPWFIGRLMEKGRRNIGDRFEHFVETRYRPFLKLALKYRYITLSSALALLIMVGGYGYSDHMGMVMMPEVAADEIEAGVRLPAGTTTDQAAKVAMEITESTQRMFDKHNLYEVAEGIKTNVRGQSFIDVEIVMRPPSERDMTAAEVIQLWRNEIGDIEGVDQISFEAERGPGGWRQDISVDLSHSDLNVLREASMAFKSRMEAYEATRDVSDNYNKGKMQFDFRLLPEGRALGFTSAEVGSQLRNAFFGSLAMRQLRGTNETEIRVKLPREERRELQNLEDFLLRSPTGVLVPLLDVVEVREDEAYSSMNRRDGRRVVNVGMDVEPSNAVSRVLQSITSEELPKLRADFPGITWSFEGSQAEMRESTQALWGGFALALLVMYGLLAVMFGNYSQPLIVLIAIPFGIVGGVIGHILLGHDLSLISVMGVVALSGVVVNDSLIMIDYANHKRKTEPALQSIFEAGVRRVRPILLTTLTTFGGLTPIILETSMQAYYLIPMAISLGFGIVFATSIILLLVPALYMIFDDISNRFRPSASG